MPMNRYSNKRHRGPGERGYHPTYRSETVNHIAIHLCQPKHGRPVGPRAFILHPTKGWRSTGPEGARS